jgi:hypothetical protein
MKRMMTAVAGCAAATALTVSVAVAPVAADGSDHGGPFPYSLLAAEWWQWALEAPTPDNPLLDTTGADCAVDQPSALLWYLAGTVGSEPVSRTCVVPRGRALFFPVVNLFYGAFLNDPPETRTTKFVRAQVACVEGSTGTVTVDGRTLPARLLVNEKSRIFSVQLPDDNIFGLTPEIATDLLLSPSADQGTYVLLPPLRLGQHIIRIQSTLSPACGFVQRTDVTYTLTIR